MRAIFSNKMDVKAEKLYLIEQLARLQDTKIIQQIKDILSSQTESISGYKPTGEPITKSDLIARAEASNKAIKERKLTSIDDLEEESENWKE